MSRRKSNFVYDAYDEKIIEASISSKGERLLSNRRKMSLNVLSDELNNSSNKIAIKYKNQKQREFIESIENNEITICIGDSGVGKSYLSIAKALELLKNPANKYTKIYIITPIVEVEDNIGYLKGDLNQKIEPYLYSIYYLMDKIIGEETRQRLVENEIIKPLVISYLRGVNLDNCILLSDETQNMSIKGVKTLLTRIGENSKFILSGDINQIDRFKKTEDSGLRYIFDNLNGIDGIGFVEFSKSDIVRNPIIGEILEKFDNPK